MIRLEPLAQPVCLEIPERLTPGSAWHEHIPFAMSLVALLRPRVLVELGTQHGDSYCAFCQSVKTLGADTRCHAIATWEDDAHAGFHGSEILADLRRHHDPRFQSFSRLIQGSFDKEVACFADGSIDLLHIDGHHTYDAVRHDFETWLPKTSARAVVLLHGIGLRERDFDVWRLWQELASRSPHFAFVHSYGLGVLAVGGEPPDALGPLFDASEEDTLRIRRLFSELGHRLTLRVQRDELQAERDRLQAERNRLDVERDLWTRAANTLQETVERLEAEIGRLEGELRARDDHLAQAAWMKAHPLWQAYLGARLRLLPRGSRRERLWYLTRGKLSDVRVGGPSPAVEADGNRAGYARWLERHRVRPADIPALRTRAWALTYRPTISVVTRVHETREMWLREAVDSVRGQAYGEWELCLVDDASAASHVRPLLAQYAALDPRIRATFLPERQGCAAAANEGLRRATGEFVVFLDPADVLYPDALIEVARRLELERDLDVVYSDEDKLAPDGRRVEPFFKPDWSPDLLLATNYVGHGAVYRRTVLEALGGLRVDFEGAQDYDLILRVGERTGRIGHVPRVLYGRRHVPGAVPGSLDAEPGATDAERAAVGEAAARRGGDRVEPASPGRHHVRYALRGTPKISIIVPMRDHAGLTRRCVASIEARSHYRNIELLILDNGSVQAASRRYLKQAALRHRVISYDRAFNYSALNNVGAAHATGEYLLFLNNDTEVETPGWLEAMLEHAQRPEVGAVGAKLLYPDRRIQHGGVVLMGTTQTFAGHAFKNLPEWTQAYSGLAHLVRNVSAVTGACMMVRRQAFDEIGGFDDAIRVVYGDVDFCLRLRQAGYVIVYTPLAALIHHESATRRTLHPPEDERLIRQRWGPLVVRGDPYSNPNFSRTREDFGLDV